MKGKFVTSLRDFRGQIQTLGTVWNHQWGLKDSMEDNLEKKGDLFF